MGNASEAELSELMGYNPVWFWVMSFITLSIILTSIFFIIRMKRPSTTTKVKNLMTVGYAEELDKAFILVNSQQMSIPEACQRVSLVLRQFIEQQTQVPATAMVLTDLQNSNAPQKLLETITYAYPIIFKGQAVENYDEFLRFMNTARAILDGWWD
jgi:hypothetical protein